MATYKLDGAKFSTLEELKETLWELYEPRMSKEVFDKHIQDNIEISE